MRSKSILPCALLALAFAGCHGVGPDYHGPPAPGQPDPTKYKNADNFNPRWKNAQPDDKNPRGSWWEVFHDPDLDRLEAAAAAGNQDLALSVARLAESRAQTRVAASDFYPHADFNGNYNRERTSNNDPYQTGRLVKPKNIGGAAGGAGGTTGGGTAGGGALTLTQQPLTRTYSLFREPVDLNWEIDLFGRVRRNTAAARADRQAAEADAANVNLSVTANVAVQYFNLRAADAEIGVIENTIKARRQALDIAQERLQAGLTSELDVQRERAELAGNEADLAASRRGRAELENALATLVGQPASTFRQRRHELHAAPPRVPAGLPSELLERRPDVAEAERELAAANERVGVAVAAFFPRVTLDAHPQRSLASSIPSWNVPQTKWTKHR